MNQLESYQDKQGHWRWRAKAANGKIVADSGEGYHEEEDCLRGMRLAATALQDFAEALRWRPIDRELPDDAEAVLVLVEGGTVHTGSLQGDIWMLEGAVLINCKPVAWLPIPEPAI